MATIGTAVSLYDNTVAVTNAPFTVSMLEYPDGPTAQAKDSLRYNKVLPPTRASTFDMPGSGFVGFAFLTGAKRLNAFYLPSTCTEANGVRHVIGTASNNALTPDIKLLSHDIYKGCLVVSPLSMVPAGAQVGVVPLDRTDPRVAELLALVDDGIAQFDASEPLFLARCPNSTPIPGGIPTITKGAADDQAVEASVAEFGGTAGSHWLFHMLHWNADVQAAFLSEADLAKYLPPGGGDLQKHYAFPLTSYEAIHLDDDDELRIAEAKKISLIENLVALAQSKSTPTSHAAYPPLEEVRVRTSSGGATPPTIHKKVDKFDAFRKGAIARDLVLSAHWEDLDTMSRVRACELKTLACIVHESSSRSEMTTALASGLRSNAVRNTKSRDFAFRGVKLPKMEPIMAAYLAHAQVHTENLDDLSETNVTGFTFSSFFADTPASLKAKQKETSIANAEAALDETDTNRTRRNTAYTPVTMIAGFSTVLIAISNCLNYFDAKFHFSTTGGSSDDWPNYAAYLRQIGNTFTGAEAKDWLHKYQNTVEEVQLAYFVTSHLNGILARLGRICDDQVSLLPTCEFCCDAFCECGATVGDTGSDGG